MNRFEIDPVADLRLAEEFMRTPLGRHSPDLQRLLRFMRSEPMVEKPCLVTVEPNRLWALVRLSGPRDQPVVPMGRMYTDPLEAERDVFRLRWKKLTGQDLVPGGRS